jgi:hypothetical protein
VEQLALRSGQGPFTAITLPRRVFVILVRKPLPEGSKILVECVIPGEYGRSS